MLRCLMLAGALGAGVLAASAMPAAAQVEVNCSMFPPQVEQQVFSGYAQNRMCAAGQMSMWKGSAFDQSGLPNGMLGMTRFTFSDGHSMFWRSVEVTEAVNGTGTMRVYGGGFAGRSIRSQWTDIPVTERRLSRPQLARLNQIMQATGTFDHAVGSWDQLDGETIYLHCQMLEMERLQHRDYRYSSVNIGCNRPDRLMPLVNEIIQLADIGMVASGWAGR